ncbi:unnamed protein product [Agarophyton chilense]
MRPVVCQAKLGKRVGSSSHFSNARVEPVNSNPVRKLELGETSQAIAPSPRVVVHNPTNSVYSPSVATAVNTSISIEERLNPAALIQTAKEQQNTMELLVSKVEAIQNQIVAKLESKSPSATTISPSTSTLWPPTPNNFTSSALSPFSILKSSIFSSYHGCDSEKTSV